MNNIAQYNELGNFNLEKFINDLKRYAHQHPTHLVMHTQIAKETGLNKDTVKFALNYSVSSFKTVVRLAGWAHLWLDEYREE